MKPAMIIPVVVGALLLAGCTSGGVNAPTQPPANEKRQPRRPVPLVQTFFEVASAQTFNGSGYDLVTALTASTTWATHWRTPGTSGKRSTPKAPG
jgi:hypothetical protein